MILSASSLGFTIPQNAKLIKDELLHHPKNKEIIGVLIQYINTKIYSLYYKPMVYNCPQDWAAEIAKKEIEKEVNNG